MKYCIDSPSNQGFLKTVASWQEGTGILNVTLAEVTKIISEADSSIGQIPQNHLYIVESIRLDGTEEQKRFFFDLVLQGKRFGNAFSKIGTKSVTDVQTRLQRSGDGYTLNGRRFYSIGALLATDESGDGICFLSSSNPSSFAKKLKNAMDSVEVHALQLPL